MSRTSTAKAQPARRVHRLAAGVLQAAADAAVVVGVVVAVAAGTPAAIAKPKT